MGVKKTSDVFIQYVSNNQGIIHKVCNIYCNNEEEKNDLKQEIILQLWKSFPNFKANSKFSTWMYRIALNTAITNIRKSKKHPIVEALTESEIIYEEPEYDARVDEDVNGLYRAISKLNEIEKGIILMYLEKSTYAEIGEVTGLSEKNVSVKIVRIKAKLKQIMTQK